MRTPRPRKFTPGAVIKRPLDVLRAAERGKWIYFGPRVYSATWIANMNFSCVMNYVAGGRLKWAIRQKDAPYLFKAKWWAPGCGFLGEWEVHCSEIPEAKSFTAFTLEAVLRDAQALAEQYKGIYATTKVIFDSPTPDHFKPPLLLPA